ncbi:hypothetical protein NA57DRAFT_70698 [Rhizodiscina lignyota]|uniref:Protein AF-9 homolog n=1 Tax=Rhizodiscina lignyota TaxID=1504668 RepID=A0A9P4IRJ6_9PEZI|nr:hypothetical protein NA57DRAFT_70698 [Rhizodiscina lignyota]
MASHDDQVRWFKFNALNLENVPDHALSVPAIDDPDEELLYFGPGPVDAIRKQLPVDNSANDSDQQAANVAPSQLLQGAPQPEHVSHAVLPSARLSHLELYPAPPVWYDDAPISPAPDPARKKQRTKKSGASKAAMSTPQKRRVKGKRISRRFIVGNEAWPVSDADRAKNPGIPENYKIKWRLYLRNVEGGPDLSTWLDRVTFKIHDDFKPNNNRMIENPPFEFIEFGFGGFFIDVRLHFKTVVGERPVWRHQVHFLQLEPYGNEEQRAAQVANGNHVISETLEVIEFNEPYAELWDALTSENQWDYLEQQKAAAQRGRGKGKGQAAYKLPPGQVAKDELGNERTVELKEKGTHKDPYSKAMEKEMLDLIKRASDEVDKEMAEVNKKRENVERQLAELKASGDLKKK